MIQVDPLPPPRAASRAGRGPVVGGFSVVSGPALVAAAPALAGLESASLVLLQEASVPRTAADRDRAARARCGGLLAALGRVQVQLLGGAGAGDALERLGGLAADAADAADPELRATLASALTRARVELARQGNE